MALNAMMASLSLGTGAQQPVTLRRFEGFKAAGAAHHVPLVAARSRQAAAQRVPLRIWAARIGGVEIPNKKRIEFSLQYVYGIGHTTAKAILSETGVENKRTFELSEEELSSIRDEVEKYSIEGDLRRFNSLNIKRLKDIQCYRGRRHIMNLPCHGQRTKTNARTRKGKARTVPNKKK